MASRFSLVILVIFISTVQGAAVSHMLTHLRTEPHYNRFLEFMHINQKSYINSPVEHERRFRIFQENLEKIAQAQARDRGTAKYGITQFSDMTTEEFVRKYTGFKMTNQHEPTLPRGNFNDLKAAPPSFDWRDHGAVTPIKYQGTCGSCWAFSAVGNIEGQWAIKKGKLVSMSEQAVVDCDDVDKHCDGGWAFNAYKQALRVRLHTTDYNGEPHQCKFDNTKAVASITGALNLTANEDQLAAWLAQNGPISIALNAGDMMQYFNGIADPSDCDPKGINHSVLLIGYGFDTASNLPYWIVKNSWGDAWGEDGYYRIVRGKGACGLNMVATSAVI